MFHFILYFLHVSFSIFFLFDFYFDFLVSNTILQSRSTPSPALSNSEMTSNISSMYPTLSQAIGFNNQSSNMPNLSPFWAASKLCVLN